MISKLTSSISFYSSNSSTSFSFICFVYFSFMEFYLLKNHLLQQTIFTTQADLAQLFWLQRIFSLLDYVRSANKLLAKYADLFNPLSYQNRF